MPPEPVKDILVLAQVKVDVTPAVAVGREFTVISVVAVFAHPVKVLVPEIVYMVCAFGETI